MFHKEGRWTILWSFLIVTTVVLLVENLVVHYWVQVFIQLPLLIFLGLILWFFRNPKRPLPSLESSQIIAPCDGKVVAIQNVLESQYFNQERIQVSIFLSPFNVHVTRYPISGKIIDSKHHKGKYLVAWHPKSSLENERTAVVIENQQMGKILYCQIAGFVARRIVNYAQVNQQVIQGADSGFIKFGSRVDLYLPLDVELNVKVGQKVKGNIHRIAKKQVGL
ncbi:MAG: phosphatidylserine decarboxylase family protein [Flavobacteriaceae bacterium]|nr:phosphatidylserine decarboxylase family protein [Flavobacteriaceae bacterium]